MKNRPVSPTTLLITLLIMACGYFVIWPRIRAADEESAKASDAAFCKKNLEYYERFCKNYPNDDDCMGGGPRKLAHCE